MGNYGNTLDRWYRRAAVVVWPRDRAFAARAEAGSQWALSQLRDRIEAGDLEGARAAAESLAPFWRTGSDRRRDCWVRRCRWRQAWTLPGRQRCCWSRSGSRRSRRSTRAGWRRRPGSTARSGRASVIDGWFGPGHHSGTGQVRVGRSSLPGLCGGAACRRGSDRWRGCWPPGPGAGWATSCGSGPATARTEIRQPQLEMLSSPLVRLLEAADDELRDEIVAALRAYGDNVLECLMPALRSAAALPAAARRAQGSTRSRGTARNGSARSSRGRCATKTTGRSHGPGAGATCVTRWGRFSAPGRDGSSSGRWRQTGGGTCTPGSTRPGCRCGTRPGGRDGRTRWC